MKAPMTLMKQILIVLGALTISACGLSQEQKMALANAQHEAEQVERRGLEEQQKTDELKHQVELLDKLTPQQRLERVISQLNHKTAETDQTTQGGALLGCVLGVTQCGR